RPARLGAGKHRAARAAAADPGHDAVAPRARARMRFQVPLRARSSGLRAGPANAATGRHRPASPLLSSVGGDLNDVASETTSESPPSPSALPPLMELRRVS